MRSLIDTDTIQWPQIEKIFSLADRTAASAGPGHVACSFEGLGTRTRTTFELAVEEAGFTPIELPRFLSSAESARDLAGYLDEFYDLYIIRFRDHRRLADFARHTKRPVINAMSAYEHPCEAMADAYWFHTAIRPLRGAGVVLWGPETNVLRSWNNVAKVSGARVFRAHAPGELPENADLVVTDGWPDNVDKAALNSLREKDLVKAGKPVLIPTPPFTIGEEVGFDPLEYEGFAGYHQKRCLVPVQRAIILYLLKDSHTQNTAGDNQMDARGP